jgi:CBS domain-containing protein
MDSPTAVSAREPGRQATVRQVMRPAVSTVERHAHLAAAAYLMMKANDTAVVVTTDDESRRPIAIITDVDITYAVADGKDVNDVRIDQLIGPDPLTVQPDATVNEAAELMLSAGIHHLPVVDNDHLIGIVDMADACRALLGATLA